MGRGILLWLLGVPIFNYIWNFGQSLLPLITFL